jgi:hypothetical protein
MACIFVKTTGYHIAVPGDDGAVPHFPAMIKQVVFKDNATL